MLRKEVPVKVEIVTLRKTIAKQILRYTALQQNEYEIVGWFSAQFIGWRNSTNIAILVKDIVHDDFALVDGYRRQDKIITRYGEEVIEHIYIK